MNEMPPIPTSKDYTEPTTLEACDRELARLESEIAERKREGLSITVKGQERARWLRRREEITEQTNAYNFSGTLMRSSLSDYSDEDHAK